MQSIETQGLEEKPDKKSNSLHDFQERMKHSLQLLTLSQRLSDREIIISTVLFLTDPALIAVQVLVTLILKI